MKKLLFFILFFNILSFSQNLYFYYPAGQEAYYIHNNEQPFNSSDGYAQVNSFLMHSSNYRVDEYRIKWQDPDGNWSIWYLGQHTIHHCKKAGIWHVYAQAHVYQDVWWGNVDYWIDTAVLYFYVYDSDPPSTPQNLSASGLYNVQLSWSAVTQEDFSLYEVSRKVREYGDNWVVIGSTSSANFIDYEYAYNPYPGNFHLTYRVRAKDINNNYSNYSIELAINGEEMGKKTEFVEAIDKFELKSNYPNPFNPSTKIHFSIPDKGIVNLKVYDLLGNEVALLINDYLEKGSYSVDYIPQNLSSGTYIYTIRYKDKIQSRRMIYLK